MVTAAATANYNSATKSVSVNVAQAATTTALTAPGITFNADGTVTVTVSSASGRPTGIVSLFVDGGTALTQRLDAGSTIFTIPSPSVGYHSLLASYAAQGNFAASSTSGTLQVRPLPASTGKAVGEGRLDAERSFDFEARGKVKHGVLMFQGELEYRDQQNGIRLASTSITSFRIEADGHHASFSGTAKVNSKMGYTFTVTVEDPDTATNHPDENDEGESGKGVDRFRIQISGPAGFSYDSDAYASNAGLLTAGRIEIQKGGGDRTGCYEVQNGRESDHSDNHGDLLIGGEADNVQIGGHGDVLIGGFGSDAHNHDGVNESARANGGSNTLTRGDGLDLFFASVASELVDWDAATSNSFGTSFTAKFFALSPAKHG
jgi:hypothetical protein